MNCSNYYMARACRLSNCKLKARLCGCWVSFEEEHNISYRKILCLKLSNNGDISNAAIILLFVHLKNFYLVLLTICICNKTSDLPPDTAKDPNLIFWLGAVCGAFKFVTYFSDTLYIIFMYIAFT